jgi:hypothetical protein
MRQRYRQSTEIDLEPCTIDAGIVADFLERSRRPRMASFVRELADARAPVYQLLALHERQVHELSARLERYEPRGQKYEPCTGVPPPESSD